MKLYSIIVSLHLARLFSCYSSKFRLKLRIIITTWLPL